MSNFDVDAFYRWLQAALEEFAGRPRGTTTLDDRAILFEGLVSWPLPPPVGDKLSRPPTWLETISTAAVLRRLGVPLASEFEAWLEGHEAQFLRSIGEAPNAAIVGPAAEVLRRNLAVTREHLELSAEERGTLGLWRDEPVVTYVQHHPRMTRIDVYAPDQKHVGTENFVGRLWRSKP